MVKTNNNLRIEIIQKIPENDKRSALNIWSHSDNELKYKQIIPVSYPIIIKTTTQQIIAAIRICSICNTNLQTLLLDTLKKITSINTLNDLPFNKYQLIIKSPINNLLSSLKIESVDSIDKLDTINNVYQYKTNKIRNIIENINDNTIKKQKYLITFDLYYDDYDRVNNLNNSLTHHDITNIDHLFKTIINYITKDIINNDLVYQLNTNAQLTKYKHWLIDNPDKY